MRNVMTPEVLKTMIPQEFEDWRDGGEDLRRELTHAVMHDLVCPDGWDMNGEYRSEYGGFFPVQIRFTPSHGNFQLAAWTPEVISHMLSLTACLDADGYSHASIIDILAMEGAL